MALHTANSRIATSLVNRHTQIFIAHTVVHEVVLEFVGILNSITAIDDDMVSISYGYIDGHASTGDVFDCEVFVFVQRNGG